MLSASSNPHHNCHNRHDHHKASLVRIPITTVTSIIPFLLAKTMWQSSQPSQTSQYLILPKNHYYNRHIRYNHHNTSFSKIPITTVTTITTFQLDSRLELSDLMSGKNRLMLVLSLSVGAAPPDGRPHR